MEKMFFLRVTVFLSVLLLQADIIYSTTYESKTTVSASDVPTVSRFTPASHRTTRGLDSTIQESTAGVTTKSESITTISPTQKTERATTGILTTEQSETTTVIPVTTNPRQTATIEVDATKTKQATTVSASTTPLPCTKLCHHGTCSRTDNTPERCECRESFYGDKCQYLSVERAVTTFTPSKITILWKGTMNEQDLKQVGYVYLEKNGTQVDKAIFISIHPDVKIAVEVVSQNKTAMLVAFSKLFFPNETSYRDWESIARFLIATPEAKQSLRYDGMDHPANEEREEGINKRVLTIAAAVVGGCLLLFIIVVIVLRCVVLSRRDDDGKPSFPKLRRNNTTTQSWSFTDFRRWVESRDSSSQNRDEVRERGEDAVEKGDRKVVARGNDEPDKKPSAGGPRTYGGNFVNHSFPDSHHTIEEGDVAL